MTTPTLPQAAHQHHERLLEHVNRIPDMADALLTEKPDEALKHIAEMRQFLTGTLLPRAAVTDDIRHGFVYERVQHITLKSIANNPDIVEGMSRAEIDATWKLARRYDPVAASPATDRLYARWQSAVARAREWALEEAEG